MYSANLAYSRRAKRKALNVRQHFHSNAVEKDEFGNYTLPKNKYLKLERKYRLRAYLCIRSHRRASKLLFKSTAVSAKHIKLYEPNRKSETNTTGQTHRQNSRVVPKHRD